MLTQFILILAGVALCALVFRRPRRHGWTARGYLYPHRRFRFRFTRNRALRRRQDMFRVARTREGEYRPVKF